MIKAGIIGATGYAGAELARILGGHPEVELVALTTRSYAGKPFWEVYPHLYKYVPLTCEELNLPELVDRCDIVFTALPHGHAVEVAEEVQRKGKKLIDLGADLRFDDAGIYENWYKIKISTPELAERAVYGLPEINRELIKEAKLVGNPGCYPTGAILALAPFLKNGLADTSTVIIDSKSGVSGAGRSLKLTTHYSEVNENMQAYNVGFHRHTPEIEQELGKLAGDKVTVSFTPHLAPMTRGILSTIYVKLKKPLDNKTAREHYLEFYKDEQFVRILPEGVLPQTKAVYGSNYCDISIVIDSRTGRAVIISAIDNLVKGASGQAVQNMNLMFDFPENTALDFPGIYP